MQTGFFLLREVCDGASEAFDRVLELPETHVAGRAEQAAHSAGHMIVVDHERVVLECRVRNVVGMCVADGTAVSLLLLHALHITHGDSVSAGSFLVRPTELAVSSSLTTATQSELGFSPVYAASAA
jgi:hypothetical protein